MFNKEKYIQLLLEICPRPITSPEDYQEILNQMHKLKQIKAEDISGAELAMQNLLNIILEAYESIPEEDRFDWKEFLAAFGDIDDVEG